ncbi:MAG: HAMP domain-containing histidine kinase [Clostridia bacterium]|jgi:signal transduction histidine kinase|nr:HAMP domain-containing histidine kinase [Clostridia bacterium]
MAFNEMLLEGVNAELQREFLIDTRRSSNQLLRFINDLLDMAKLDAGRMELEVSIFDLPELVREVTEQVNPVVMMKDQMLVTTLAEKLPPVNADYRKMEQILSNLVGNAVKFTPNGGKITITARYCSQDNKVHVAVIDTGPGIRDEDKEIIFDAFRQVNGSSTREHRGSGLGLALSKKLVNMHRCMIWVESTYGQGSKFTFTVPVACIRNLPEGGK